MGEIKTLAILLHQTLLPNDDAALEFFTVEWGRITLFCRKFANSKKRRTEIDFFRLLELEVFQGRNQKSLKGATVVSLFHSFGENYKSSQIGFRWIARLREVLPESQPNQPFFQQVAETFGHFESTEAETWDLFFRIKILIKDGIFPHFDETRSDIFFDPASGKIFEEKQMGCIFIENLTRQLLEFFRRTTVAECSIKTNKLPKDRLHVVQEIVSAMEQNI
jgi:DNA repair protein RecO